MQSDTRAPSASGCLFSLRGGVRERAGKHKRRWVWSSLHSGQTDCPGLREKVRHEGSRKHIRYNE